MKIIFIAARAVDKLRIVNSKPSRTNLSILHDALSSHQNTKLANALSIHFELVCAYEEALLLYKTALATYCRLYN